MFYNNLNIVLLDIKFIPSLLTIDFNNKYLSRLIDSDGTVVISVSKTNSTNSLYPD